MIRTIYIASCFLILLCLLLTCCSEDIPDVPEPLTEEEFLDIKGPKVEILIPMDGEAISWMTNIGGTYERVSEGQNILVFASPYPVASDLWYPRDIATMNTNGVWEATIFIGQEGTPSGTKFDIGVIVAGEDRLQEILEEIESKGDSEPITLPDEILARITVTRK